jgi:hypothetical protein
LQPVRRNLSASDIDRLEKQFLRKSLLDAAGLPRLSLFHW